MRELRTRQRAVLTDKLPDVANVSVGAMFFGQFLSEGPFSPVLALAGVLTWVSLFCFAVMLAGKEGS